MSDLEAFQSFYVYVPFWLKADQATNPSSDFSSLVVRAWVFVVRMSRFPPAALAKQMALAAARVDDGSSVASWTRLDPWEEDDDLPPAGLPLPHVQPPPPPPKAAPPSIPEEETKDGDQPAQTAKAAPAKAAPAADPAASSSAPVNQAARGFLDHSHETPAARKLRHDQERASKRGKKKFRWGRMAPGNLAQNPMNAALPDHISQVGAGPDERSVKIVDGRDRRLQSPFQEWLLDEILTNALSYINVKADRQMVRAPSHGYHCNLFLVRTMDGVKLTVCCSMTSYGSVPAARWDTMTGAVLSHAAFQPFRWPPMTDRSPTWVDVKVKLEGHLLIHLELRGYRSDSDMTMQLCHVSDAVHSILSETCFTPSFVVTIFQGWRVVACSWEIGGRLYACSEDFPLCHAECRFVATSSPDSFGMDADRLEFRFLSAGDRLDVACSIMEAPPSWLVASRVSGPTLIKNARWIREHGARVECPDQALQLSQLAAVHAHWTAATEAQEESETGARISAIAVESNPINLHLISESPLFRKEKVMVRAEALALQCHDPLDEVLAAVVPPLSDGPSVRPADQRMPMHYLDGPKQMDPVAAAPVSSAKPSLTNPGQAPAPSSWQGQSLAPARRTLEQRRADGIDSSAMTPQAFVEMARAPYPRQPNPASTWSTKVTIEEVNSIGDPQAPSTEGRPVSFGPKKDDPNVTDV